MSLNAIVINLDYGCVDCMLSYNSLDCRAAICEPKEPYFSWTPCDECNSNLGGNRYDVVYRKLLEGQIYFASICEDCYLELCG